MCRLRRPGPEPPHLVLVALRCRLAEVPQGVPEGRADEQAVLAAQSVGRDAPVPPSEGPGPRMLEESLVTEADPQAALVPREEALRLQVEDDLLLAFETGERHPQGFGGGHLLGHFHQQSGPSRRPGRVADPSGPKVVEHLLVAVEEPVLGAVPQTLEENLQVLRRAEDLPERFGPGVRVDPAAP